MHASVSYAHAEGIQNEHLKNRKTDAHADYAHKELMHMLRFASIPDPYAQRAHKGRSMLVRNSIFSIIFKLPKTSKI